MINEFESTDGVFNRVGTSQTLLIDFGSGGSVTVINARSNAADRIELFTFDDITLGIAEVIDLL